MAKVTTAAGISEVLEAVKFTSAAGVSAVPEAAVMWLPWKGVGSRFEVEVEIPFGESGRLSSVKKDGKLFFFLLNVVRKILKNVRWDRTRMIRIHIAHKSFESLIFRKSVNVNRMFDHIRNWSFRNTTYRGWKQNYRLHGQEWNLKHFILFRTVVVVSILQWDSYLTMSFDHLRIWCTSLQVISSSASCDLLMSIPRKLCSLEA